MKMIKIIFPILILLVVSCSGKRLASTSNLLKSEVYFKFDSYRVQSSYASMLKEVSTYLRENPKAIIVIEGHTDRIGSKFYNYDLGDKRARSVKTFFVKNGVNPKRIIVTSFGESNPIDSIYLKRNRRVIFRNIND